MLRVVDLELRVSGRSVLVVHVRDNLDVAVVHVAAVDVSEGLCELRHPDYLPFAITQGFSLEREQRLGV